MTNAKKILITTESREVFIVRFNENSDMHGWCEACAADTKMLTLDNAVSFAGTPTRELIRQTDAGAIHSIETVGGHLLLCQNSLQGFFKRKEKEKK